MQHHILLSKLNVLLLNKMGISAPIIAWDSTMACTIDASIPGVGCGSRDRFIYRASAPTSTDMIR